VCVCMYVWIHVYVCVGTCVCICVDTCIRVFGYVGVCESLLACASIFTVILRYFATFIARF